MALATDLSFSFVRGLRTDGGPFFTEQGFYQDAKNTVHHPTGEIENRRGIEILSGTGEDTITSKTDATNLFLASMAFAEIIKDDGTRMNCVFLRNGRRVRIYCNDGVTYTNSLENLNINTPDFDITLSDVSDESFYYKARWAQEENSMILTLARSPIYKITWASSTFTAYRIQLIETNEAVYEIPVATARSSAMPGWYSVDIPLKTDTTSYTLDQFFSDVVPAFTPTIYEYDSAGLSTLVDAADYTYSEAIDSDINFVTLSLTYTTATTGKTLRIYLGRTTLPAQNSALSVDQILVSAITKDFSADVSFSPSTVVAAFGRIWFAGQGGAIDAAQAAAIPGYAAQYKKIWVSELFPKDMSKAQDTTLDGTLARGPLDFISRERTAVDGGVIEPDNAATIKGLAVYESSAIVAAENGIWAISGPDEVFNFLQIQLTKVADVTITASEPILSTDSGVFVATENDVYQLLATQPQTDVSPLPKHFLVENVIESYYRAITPEAKAQSFLRDDKYNRRVYYWYPDTTSNNKYKVSGAAQKFLVFDRVTNSWQGVGDLTAGDWSVMDMVTVPADSYFTSSDARYPLKRVNLVLLARKEGLHTVLTFGILEGKNYCADYYGTDYQAPFDSYVECLNSFGTQLGALNKKSVFSVHVAMKRTEQAAATAGFYEFPGAVWMHKRVQFADNSNAGPLYSYTYDSATDAWVVNPKQIYFPYKLGSTVVGGGKPSLGVVVAKLKVAGKGAAVRLRFGNYFGNTDLTGTLQEQVKPWGVYGYQIDFKR